MRWAHSNWLTGTGVSACIRLGINPLPNSPLKSWFYSLQIQKIIRIDCIKIYIANCCRYKLVTYGLVTLLFHEVFFYNRGKNCKNKIIYIYPWNCVSLIIIFPKDSNTEIRKNYFKKKSYFYIKKENLFYFILLKIGKT